MCEPEEESAIDAMIAEGGPAANPGRTKTVDEPKRVWSDNEESFSCDSLAELLAGMEEPQIGDVVYVGDQVTPDPSGWVDADDVIEQLACRAYDNAGEWADDYPQISKEAKEELQLLLETWANTHAKPSFYLVNKVREHEITAEDLAELERSETPA